MANVHVVFPTAGVPNVFNYRQPALYEEFILWDFHCDNKKVKWIRIGFKDQNAQYFPKGNIEETWCEKEVKRRHTGSNRRRARTKAQMWGQCPDYSNTQPKPKKHKYTIYGLTSPAGSGVPDPETVVCELDPEIDPINPI